MSEGPICVGLKNRTWWAGAACRKGVMTERGSAQMVSHEVICPGVNEVSGAGD